MFRKKLESLLSKLIEKEICVSYFIEPDLNNELTSICFIETNETKRLTLSLKNFKIEYYDID